jgi:hypothetical protein
MEEITLHKGQVSYLQNKPDARFRFAVAGVQGGKTLSLCVGLAIDIQAHSNERFMITSPTHKMMGTSTLLTFEEVYGDNLVKRKVQSGELIDNKGNLIFLRTTEDPNSLRGPTLKGGAMDECTFSPKVAFDIFVQRLVVKQGRLWCATTPRSKWIRDIRRRANEPEYLVESWKSNLNPEFENLEYERLKREHGNDAWFRQEYDAEDTDLGGLVFPEFDPEIHVGVTEYNPNWPVYWGMDFGIGANPSFISYWQIDEEKGHHYLIDELWLQGQNIYNVLGEGLKFSYPKPALVACDPSGRHREHVSGFGTIDVLAEYGLSPFFRKDWNLGQQRAKAIQEIHKLFRTLKVTIGRHCVRFINGIETWAYEQKPDGTQGNTPAKDGVADHPMETWTYHILAHPTGYDFATEEQKIYKPSSPYTLF